MKVLQINCVYGSGSTGTLTQDIHRSLLSRGIGSVVCYGRGGRTPESGIIKLCPEWYAKGNSLLSRIRGLPYGGCYVSTHRLIWIMKRERPDVVHLQCINGHFVNMYKLVSWLKNSGIRTILTLHAEFPYTANCAHALDCEKWKTGCGHCPRLRQATGNYLLDGTARSCNLMQKAFEGFGKKLTVVSVSPWLRRRAEQSPILRDMPHRVIPNGVDTAVFTYRPGTGIRQKHGITGKYLVFYAAPVVSDDPAHLKGGYYLLELAKRMQGLPVQFLAAGKCKIRGKVPANVILLGELRDRELLAEYYSAADVTLLTSRRETFSMVCAESLCCGTPVVGFQAGGPESIAIAQFSRFVKYGDMDQLLAVVKAELSRAQTDKAAISLCARQAYSNEEMFRQYEAIYLGE